MKEQNTGEYDALVDCLDEVVAQLDGKEWSPDTLDTIAGILRSYGYTIREPVEGCGAQGPYGYLCTHHENGQHVARGTEPDSFAESWPIVK